jgi:hypothetical protein
MWLSSDKYLEVFAYICAHMENLCILMYIWLSLFGYTLSYGYVGPKKGLLSAVNKRRSMADAKTFSA